MKHSIYPKLAWTGIRKNGRLYLPYILTCVGMVMMFYIVSYLSSSEYLASCRGGEQMQQLLTLGCGVIGVFATVFLFYTNSFLMRRRKKEFGLYNILGMGKWNIARVLLWESLMIAGIAIGVGLFAGVAFSKVAELCMVNILKADTSFFVTIEAGCISRTAVLFGIIFLLILLNALRQLHFSNPIELLHSENTGEKPPRANWLFALAGAALLAGAYYLAVTLENPIEVLMLFFVAVIMVIAATYLLFVSGSVTICRSLQKNKRYYYRTNHFVSVSSMVYRMRRNGAGLASICILCTMVLVMVSSTSCLYIGTEDSLRERYPRHINVSARTYDISVLSGAQAQVIKGMADAALSEYGETAKNVLDYRLAEVAVLEKDGVFYSNDSGIYEFQGNFGNIWELYIVPLEDYNRLMGEQEELSEGEALIYTTKKQFKNESIVINGAEPLRVKRAVEEFIDNGEDAASVIPSIFLFVPDFEKLIGELSKLTDYGGERALSMKWIYGFDLDCGDEEQLAVYEAFRERVRTYRIEAAEEAFDSVVLEGAVKERADFYGLYGGLFFLGILLGIVFVFATVLIMYYKQISEGYEDQARFEIMQKVGMTKLEIRKSVNSQVITVFFLPLAAAGLHLAFAFPMVQKCLLLLGLANQTLLILVTAACFGMFALLYVLVYRITSHSYYAIVSGMDGRGR